MTRGPREGMAVCRSAPTSSRSATTCDRGHFTDQLQVARPRAYGPSNTPRSPTMSSSPSQSTLTGAAYRPGRSGPGRGSDHSVVAQSSNVRRHADGLRAVHRPPTGGHRCAGDSRVDTCFVAAGVVFLLA